MRMHPHMLRHGCGYKLANHPRPHDPRLPRASSSRDDGTRSISATRFALLRPRKSGSQVTPRWSKADSNPRSRSCERDHGVLPKGGLGTTSRVPKSALRSSRETVTPVGASPRPSRSRRDRDFEFSFAPAKSCCRQETQFTRCLGSPTEENHRRPGRSIRWCASGTLRKPLSPWPRRQPQPHASTAFRRSGGHHFLGAARHEAGMDHPRRNDDNADLGSEHPSQRHAHCIVRRF